MNKPKKKAKLFSFKYLLIDFIRITGAIPTLLWYRPKVMYENASAKKKIRGGALVIANHNFFFDPITVMLAIWYRRHRFICNKEFYETGAKWFFRAVRCIPIDIENFNLGSLRQINACLDDGELVSMFPEGHINDGSGEMRQFKSGMVLMAMRSKVPIIPLYAAKHKPAWRRLRVAIGEPIDIEARFGSRPTMAQIEELTAELYEKENKLRTVAEQR